MALRSHPTTGWQNDENDKFSEKTGPDGDILYKNKYTTIIKTADQKIKKILDISYIKINDYRSFKLAATEYDTLRKVQDHPHIVKCYGVETNELKEIILTLEYYPLGDLLKNHHDLLFDDLKIVFKQIASAIGYIHSKNIIHRDIKPENIFIRSRDPVYAVLGDFGLAKHANNAWSKVGTEVYASPEQKMGKTCYSKPSDIYSFGMTMLTTLTSECPPDDINEFSEWYKISNEELINLIKACLQIDPKSRPSIDQIIQILDTM